MEKETELQNLTDRLNTYFKDSEYKIIETVYRGEKATKVLEIYIDHRKSVNIDDLVKINKDLNAQLDESGDFGDLSNIIVSSPGAENPIKHIWQLEKHTGRILETEYLNGDKSECRLISLNEPDDTLITEVQIKEKGSKHRIEPKEIKFKDLKDIKVKLSFSK